MDCSPLQLLCLWDSPGKDTRMGCCVLLQGISLKQESNLCLLYLLHYQAGSLSLRAVYDPEIPLLGIYSEKTVFEKDTYAPVFMATLFTIPRTWKQLRCSSTEEWIKKVWCVYTHTHTHTHTQREEYYSARKRNAFELVLMRRMNLESEVSQK